MWDPLSDGESSVVAAAQHCAKHLRRLTEVVHRHGGEAPLKPRLWTSGLAPRGAGRMSEADDSDHGDDER